MKLTRHYIIYTFVAVLLFPAVAASQKNWTLEECIDYALEHNINIKRQKVEAEKATNNHKQSKRNLLPSASANASHSFNFGRSLNEDTYEYVNEQFQAGNIYAQSELPLFNGRENINTIKMRKYELLAQLERIEEARYDVTMNVVTSC